MKYFFSEPVPMRVIHPQKGTVDVMAYCIMDAQLGAMIKLDLSWDEVKNCKVAVSNAALQAAGYL